MIDTLLAHRARAVARPCDETLGLGERGYVVLTLHRPSNVDDPARLAAMLDARGRRRGRRAGRVPGAPAHARRRSPATRRVRAPPGVRLIEPLGYLDFLALMDRAACVLTDSGGIQEETTALGVPCLTLRENTERPVTVTEGTNTLVGADAASLAAAMADLRAGRGPAPMPRLEDGRASARVADVLARYLVLRTAALRPPGGGVRCSARAGPATFREQPVTRGAGRRYSRPHPA